MLNKNNAMDDKKNEATSNSQRSGILQQSETIRSNLQNISQLLNTGLSHEALDICVKLIEKGVHPQALAEVVFQINRELSRIKPAEK